MSGAVFESLSQLQDGFEISLATNTKKVKSTNTENTLMH